MVVGLTKVDKNYMVSFWVKKYDYKKVLWWWFFEWTLVPPKKCTRRIHLSLVFSCKLTKFRRTIFLYNTSDACFCDCYKPFLIYGGSNIFMSYHNILSGFMVKPHTSDIRMTYEYIRVTCRWHASIYEWHTKEIRVHTSDIQVTYKYIRVAYRWHTTAHEWHKITQEYMWLTYEWHASTCEWYKNDI